MACPATRRNLVRHFLIGGWEEFVSDNKPDVGQEVLFALTTNSFFIVKAQLPPSKKYMAQNS